MTVTQTDFRAALFSADTPVPDGLIRPDGRPAGKRFDVYRNNVAVSLTEALETAFPVVRKLLGDENFRNIAGLFLRRHPPTSPLLMFYGAEFPDFLETFEPVRKWGYLPDVARLEQALRRSYHAADAAPIDPSALQALPPERLVAATFRLHPAAIVLRSPWPVHAIWRFNTEPGAPKPQMAAEDVLVHRPEYDPEVLVLAPGQAAFVLALQTGMTLGAAVDAATGETGEFDLTATLSLLIGTAVLTGLEDRE